MEPIQAIIVWAKTQTIFNWLEHFSAFGGMMNIIIAGSKVMGWTKLAEFCGKLEDALTAMVQAYLNRNKGASNGQEISVTPAVPVVKPDASKS